MSSSKQDRQAASSPTGCRPTPRVGCCCWRQESNSNFWLKVPVGYYRTIFNERFSRLFKTEASEGTGGREIIWPRGRVIGGSSSINGLIFIRGQHEDFDDWERLGASGWSYRELLPYFRRYEGYRGGDSQYHGGFGEFEVSELRNNNAASAAWVEAGVEFGLPRNPDFNGASTSVSGLISWALVGAGRSSSASAFLKPIADRSNLTVITGAQVSKVTFKGRVATGVEWIRNGSGLFGKRRSRSHPLGRRAAVATVASTIGYRASRTIGPSRHSRHRGLSGSRAQSAGSLPGAADRRLKDRISLNDQVRNPVELAKMGLQWMFSGSGPMTVGAGQVERRSRVYPTRGWRTA